MDEQGRAGRAGRVLSGLLAGVSLAACSFAAQAAIITTLGTWYGTNGMDGTLRGRDADGNPINLLVSGAPNPALKFVYDTDRDITWLANWDVNGRMNWATAKNWAEGLSYTVGSVVVDDWVLPSALNADGTGPCNGDCTDSPMGHVWYMELGNTNSLDNTGPFSNVQSSKHWSGTATAYEDRWFFQTTDGYQGLDGEQLEFYAVAVRPGDVAAAPEPGSLALLGIAIAGLAAARRRKR